MKSQISNYLKRIRYDGLLYLANHVFANIPFHSIRKKLYRRVLHFKIGKNSYIFMRAWFDTLGHFSIGDYSVVNQNCRLDNRGGIEIGNSVSISSEVCILTADHDIQSTNFVGRSRSVRIEDFVFIGTRALILPGVTLGKGSIVAAGSIVTKSVEPFSIVAGTPAKVIGNRQRNLNYTCSYDRLFH